MRTAATRGGLVRKPGALWTTSSATASTGILFPRPPVDILDVARRSGGEARWLTRAGPVWRVTGANVENGIDETGATQAEAWHPAADQARSLGMLEKDVDCLRLNIKERRCVKINSRP
jgi:hypothetical protein